MIEAIIHKVPTGFSTIPSPRTDSGLPTSIVSRYDAARYPTEVVRYYSFARRPVQVDIGAFDPPIPNPTLPSL
jgi:hypothetical protein